MVAAAVLGVQHSTRGIRAHASASIAIAKVDKVQVMWRWWWGNDTRGDFWGEQGPLTTDSICIPAVMQCSSFTPLLTDLHCFQSREGQVHLKTKEK